ncbi:hypothetical protein G7K71_04050 [Desulfofundulus sp. TPOSR]|uniref:hypothetical protein n=1 Tax=Desulfofundulus sp. TPOSR TaxID=2714340 RepID=UPI00140A795A|nr:hypothetical protein [Desulfofundulus sp. TPOSR]NHM26186.1 hypothetical protein [Desulfofundulus sp. TPOSR]
MQPKFRFSCDGNRLIWVDYGPEDYRRLWGGDDNAYLDFLAAANRACQEARDEHPLHWPVRVPFDAEDYAAWARENPTKAGQPDAHLEWAVWVARQPQRLAALRSRHRLQCYVPSDELLRTETTVWGLPVVVYDAAAAHSLTAPLPPEFLQAVIRGLFQKLWRNAIPFERLSPLRARGFAAVPGDRLILAVQVKYLQAAIARFVARVPAELPASFTAPARHRIRPPRSYPWLEILGPPLLLIGAHDDVETAETLARCPEPEELPLDLWESFFAERGITFLAREAHRFFFEVHADGYIEEIKGSLRSTVEKPNPLRRSRLRRVK